MKSINRIWQKIWLAGPVLMLAFLLSGCVMLKTTDTTQAPAAPAEEAPAAQTEPREVVTQFMNFTLGTLPTAEVDYEQAKPLMSEQYRAEFTTPMFIPQTYGIQDGPTKVEVESHDIMGDQAEVIVMGYWGEDLQMRWKFELVMEGGDWKIDLINPGQ